MEPLEQVAVFEKSGAAIDILPLSELVQGNLEKIGDYDAVRLPNDSYLVKIDNARFSRKVVPGDQLLLEVEQIRIMRGIGKYEARASVDGERTASCEIWCADERS